MTRRCLRLAALLACLAAPATVAVQQPASPPPAQPETPQERPRFRGGANLVRVDAYVTLEGAAVTDLTAQDFEVIEDNTPQRVESFELIRPRSAGPVNERREPNTVAESRAMATEATARVFVLFMDIWHVQIEGSYHAQGPISRLLNAVIGQDDLVGVMTPEMSARNLTLARRLTTLDGILKDNWFWGQRNQLTTPDPRERDIERCYPDHGETAGLAFEMIARRRESRTLDAIEDLIVHLEGIREERKFVVLLSEGWRLQRPDQNLARQLRAPNGERMPPPGPQAIGVDPRGKLTTDPDRGSGSFDSCERERSMLAYSDHATQFDNLLQRANRANVSFYPVDARGLVVFDEPIGPRRPPPPSVDAARLQARYEGLRTLALQTDGFAVLDTNNLDKALARIVQDTGAYYLLGYYSTNTKLDGRFRKLTVRVKRPGVVIRARPGYLAPTESEMASARVDGLMNGKPAGYTTRPPGFARALDGLAPSRGNLPVRAHGAAGPQSMWVTAELDAATLKAAEWQQGGRVRAQFEHDRGAGAASQVDVAIEPGQKAFNISPPKGTELAPGRYVVRLQLTPKDGAVPLQTTVEVTVPESTALLAPTGLASRRGPSTGLHYVPTADARFRRTERLRLEVPRTSTSGKASARLLGRDGQPMQVAITLGERPESTEPAPLIVADLTLAPLAQGEYVLEVSVVDGEKTAVATYGFRLVP
jgi:VWFA-related protein